MHKTMGTMLSVPVRVGDRVVVSAQSSKYRGQKGEVVSFTPSRKSVRVQLTHQIVTVRVTSVRKTPDEVKEALLKVTEELAELKLLLRAYIQHSVSKR